MIAGDDHAAVAGEASQDGERGRTIEAIVRVEFRYMFIRLGISRHFQIAVDSEHLSDRHSHVRQARFRSGISCESHCSSVRSARERKSNPRRESGIGSRLRARFSRKFRGGESHPRSAETSRFQVIIGLNNLPEPRFGTPVTTIGVGVMPFNQDLKLGLDIGAFGIPFKAKNIEGTTLCIENLASLWRGARMTGTPCAPFAD